jgi:glycosyltransferase involved in cell wall biosynthesis
LVLGYLLKKTTSIPVIFDSHEDYFNQKFEYSGKSPIGLAQGIFARAEEILFIRYMDAVFCTDEFLNGLYRQPIFASKSVAMVRNLPPRNMIRNEPVVHDRDTLKLVYIGSVNAMRGVVNTAEYCALFNAESKRTGEPLMVSFHVFSKSSPIVDRLVGEGKIVHHGFLHGSALEEAVLQFDIGVSLLLPSKKFHRNIPIKNFEYMALGLPVLTGNFGPMKKYVGEAGAGVLIDPTDYLQFRDAILRFKDRDFRAACGGRGILYARNRLDRDAEVLPYLDTVGRILGLNGKSADATRAVK